MQNHTLRLKDKSARHPSPDTQDTLMTSTTAPEGLAENQDPQSTGAMEQTILVAEDHPASLHLLERQLESWGFQVIPAVDGEEALEILESDDAPPVAIIDWNMPKFDGVTVCTRVRAQTNRPYTYLLLLTARGKSMEILTGLNSGADDFVTKPYDCDELRSRVRVGQRVARLERALHAKVAHLEKTLSEVKTLKKLLPICMFCKSIRDGESYWQQVDEYVHATVGTDFSHGVCPKCMGKLREEFGLPE
jgi:CheY-like chemotaxis protein